MKKLQKNILLCFVLYSFLINAQSDKAALIWFDDVLGAKNSPLKSGANYDKLYRTGKGNHNFYLEDKFYLTNIQYNGQLYYDVLAKYDINSDNLVVKTNSGSIMIPRKNVSFFSIANKYNFYKIDNSFYAEVFKSKSITLLRRHIKEKIKTYKRDFVEYKFKPKIEYKVLFNDVLMDIDKKKKWILLFPEKEEEIDKFFSSYKKMFKTSKEEFFVNLIKYINN